MKKLLASASFVVLGAASAMAADMPMKAAPYYAPAPVFSWTGCYIGVHAGAGVMHDNGTSPTTFLEDNFSGGNGERGTGGLAGGQLGCNYQDGNWVIGIEGEGYWSGMQVKDLGPMTVTAIACTPYHEEQERLQHRRSCRYGL